MLDSASRGRKYIVFTYDEVMKRDKVSLDLFWLRDSTGEGDDLPAPEVLARTIIEDLQAALAQFAAIEEDLLGTAEVTEE